MKYTILGTSGLKVSSIGLGTWQLGTKGWGYGKEGFDRARALGLLEKALESGINFIDTAEVYGSGRSEEIISIFLKEHRDEVVIATKFMPLTIRPKKVAKAAKKSLKRLGIDTIDLYQIHWPNPLLPLGRTLHHMEKLVDEGLIRYIGVSNFSTGQLKKARGKMENHDIVSNQVNYSMVKRGAEKELLPYAEQENLTVIAYSPLAQGFLTTKYTADKPAPGGVRSVNRLFTKSNRKRAASLFNKLKEVASNHGVTPAQVAINWLVRNERVVAIPGANSEDQVASNAAAAEFELTDDESSTLQKELLDFKPAKLRAIPALVKNLPNYRR